MQTVTQWVATAYETEFVTQWVTQFDKRAEPSPAPTVSGEHSLCTSLEGQDAILPLGLSTTASRVGR